LNKLGIIVLSFDEVQSLKNTIRELNDLPLGFTPDIVISTSVHANIKCQEMAIELTNRFTNVKVHFQSKPFVAAAVLEANLVLDSEYIVYMSADGETPAAAIPQMLLTIEEGSFDIVSTSRWIKGGGFVGYGFFKYCLSFLAQLVCKIFFLSKLTEFTYGFRIYRKEILTQLNFREAKHPFFLESLLIPLKLGFSIKEVPARYIHRNEGKSVVNLLTLISYLRPILRIRLAEKSSLWK
jgi:dolichol-phosphate mannosyltransferase